MPYNTFSSAGLAAIQAGVVDINGYPQGITGTIAQGSGAALQLMKFAKRFGGVIPNPVRATPTGDNNRNRHEYLFSPAQMGELAFSFGALDLDAYANFANVKKVVDGNGNLALIQSNAPVNAVQVCVVVNMDTQIADAGTFGLKRFINEIYPLVTVVPTLGNVAEVAATEWSYYGVPTQTGKTPWGTAFTVAAHGATRGGGFFLTSDYPIVLETVIGSAAQTAYTLTYTPATPTATYALAWKNGVSFPVTVAGKNATFAALSAGDVVVLRYEATDLLINI